MIKVTKYLIVIIILVFAADWILYSMLENIQSKSKTGFLGKVNRVLEEKNNYKGLIFGSSRASRHISPSILGDRYYNLGSDGMESSYQLGLINILEYENKLPEIAIVVIDETEVLSKEYTIDINHLAAFYDIPFVKSEINKLGYSEKYKFLLKSYRYNGKIPTLIKNGILSKEYISNGYSPLKKSSSSLDRINRLLKKNKISESENINQKTKSNFEKLIGILSENNVKVYIAMLPSLYEMDTKSNQLVNSFLNELNGQNITFENLGLDSLEYWEDLVHMNEDGAKIISEHIKSTIDDE